MVLDNVTLLAFGMFVLVLGLILLVASDADQINRLKRLERHHPDIYRERTRAKRYPRKDVDG